MTPLLCLWVQKGQDGQPEFKNSSREASYISLPESLIFLCGYLNIPPYEIPWLTIYPHRNNERNVAPQMLDSIIAKLLLKGLESDFNGLLFGVIACAKAS